MYTEYVFDDKKYEVASKYLKSILFDIVNEETSKLADIREKIAEADESEALGIRDQRSAERDRNMPAYSLPPAACSLLPEPDLAVVHALDDCERTDVHAGGFQKPFAALEALRYRDADALHDGARLIADGLEPQNGLTLGKEIVYNKDMVALSYIFGRYRDFAGLAFGKRKNLPPKGEGRRNILSILIFQVSLPELAPLLSAVAGL